VLLSVLDRKWREHLYEMDYLREGIGLRAYSQRDPLVEYQREGFDLFSAMMDSIKEESVGYLFNIEVTVSADDAAGDEDIEGADGTDEHEHERPNIVARGLVTSQTPRKLSYSAPTVDGDGGTEVQAAETELDEFAGVSRNDPCPCGSGKKFKRCHGDPARRNA
jgi:preprotein translocase subunit SecA